MVGLIFVFTCCFKHVVYNLNLKKYEKPLYYLNSNHFGSMY